MTLEDECSDLIDHLASEGKSSEEISYRVIELLLSRGISADSIALTLDQVERERDGATGD